MASVDSPRIVIVGGGLAGSLLAVYLGRAGYTVDVYEMRGDLRREVMGGGRSINLALSHRGIEALRRVDLADRVLSTAVAMPGRMIHSPQGSLSFQPYGRDPSQAIHSVSRGGLNAVLLDAADACPAVQLHFHQKCTGMDLDEGRLHFLDTTDNSEHTVTADVVFSADGAFSAVRGALQKRDRFDFSQQYLEHGYKELSIPPAADGSFRLERNALHIWPRRSFMMIALPNADGSFTCTLFWPFVGPVSFEAVQTKDDLLRIFREQFPDALPHMPTLVEDYFANPTSSLATIRCGPWHVKGRVCLLGDAAHAVVPFYGQGMNAAFEDVLVLGGLLEQHQGDWARLFAELYNRRKRDVDTLADLAIQNFKEMRDHTGSKLFLLKKRTETMLAKLFPGWFLPLYTMVTFTRMPYHQAVRRARRQNRIVVVIVAAMVLAVVLLAWRMVS
jgi:kynurenine 3-monooxygenase